MRHTDGEVKFNGGNPVVLCGRCGVILRYENGRPYGARVPWLCREPSRSVWDTGVFNPPCP